MGQTDQTNHDGEKCELFDREDLQNDHAQYRQESCNSIGR